MEDMSDLLKQFSSMVENDQIPDNLKEIIGQMNNKNNSKEQSSEGVSSSSSFSVFDGIDINTIMKMKSIMEKMNSKDDPRANLLLSLKPYLKDSRKAKVEQYIQFLNMSKIMESFTDSGGDIKK